MSFATVINLYFIFLYFFFCIGVKNETNMYLEEPFYLLTKTWKYVDVCFVQRCWMSSARVTPLNDI